MQEKCSNNKLVMNSVAALGVRPNLHPLTESSGWDHLDLDPMARSDVSRSLLEVLASRLNEALARGACSRGSLDPCKLLNSSPEHESTGLESVRIIRSRHLSLVDFDSFLGYTAVLQQCNRIATAVELWWHSDAAVV
jgi:hypothetical protein